MRDIQGEKYKKLLHIYTTDHGWFHTRGIFDSIIKRYGSTIREANTKV